MECFVEHYELKKPVFLNFDARGSCLVNGVFRLDDEMVDAPGA